MLILRDSREQKGLRFSHPMVRTTKKVKLDTGDYGAILESKYGDYEVPVYFERKSLNDLFGTLGHGHERFRRELNRAHEKGNTIIIIIEETFSTVKRGFERSKMTGDSIIKTLMTLWIKYDIPHVFCSSRAEMSNYIVYYYLSYGKKYLVDMKKK